MSWTSLFLKTDNLKVLILGTGEVASRRANRFLDRNSQVKLIGDSISEELLDKGAQLANKKDINSLVNWADLVIIASGDRKLSNYVANISKYKLLNRADFPEKGNVIVPTTFNIGGMDISIFTNGKSPLMAKELRKKIQSIISDEDLLKIELQDYGRKLLKEKIPNQKDRRDYLYKFLNDDNVIDLLSKNQLDIAKDYIKNLIDSI